MSQGPPFAASNPSLGEESPLPELLITTPSGGTDSMPLELGSVSMGRSASNVLSFPNDEALSRWHLVLERSDDDWFVEDLDSKNGTRVNGTPIRSRHQLVHGDVIVAGKITMTFQRPDRSGWAVALDSGPDLSRLTVERTFLDEILLPRPQRPGSARAAEDRRVDSLWAFMRAGRELATARPLPELFRATLDLSLEAVDAERGVLLTIEEGDRVIVQASHGMEPHLSTTVLDQVLKERASLLVRDVSSDELLKESRSVASEGTRSLIAAPLQTEDRVLGCIYLDSIQQRREFTRDDLSLLTALANVASLQIERSRWEMQRRISVAENFARLGRLAAALNHEFNTPLGTLKSTIDSLLKAAARMASAPPEKKAQLEALQAELKGALDASLLRMEQVLGRIRRLTALDRAEVHYVDLNELLADVVGLVERHSIKIRLVADKLPLVRGNAQSLSESFESLLSFFGDAPKQDGTLNRVEISTKAYEGWVEVRVENEGAALTSQEVHRLFEPKFGIVEGRVSALEWSLLNATQVIRELGGEIRVVNEPKRRTIFVVRIPTS